MTDRKECQDGEECQTVPQLPEVGTLRHSSSIFKALFVEKAKECQGLTDTPPKNAKTKMCWHSWGARPTDEADLLAYLDELLIRAKDRPYGCVQGRMAIVQREPRE